MTYRNSPDRHQAPHFAQTREAKCFIPPRCYLAFSVEEPVEVGFLESALRSYAHKSQHGDRHSLFKDDDLGEIYSG